jgi:phosphatidylserine/phosphatidylglycerophosphate/cardiolipin synthase-like enzyme
MVIDWKIVITGSLTFTKAAEENNAENLLVIKDRKLANDIQRTGRSTLNIRRSMRGGE